MTEFADYEQWRQALLDSLAQLLTATAGLVPRIAAALVLVVLGWAVARLVEVVARRLLTRIGLDRTAERTRVSEALVEGGLQRNLSELVAHGLFWIVMLTFLLTAIDALGLAAASSTIDKLVDFFPNVIGAVLIVIVGLLGGRLVRSLVTSGAAATQLPSAARLGAAAQGLVVVVASVLALEQLGVATQLLVTVITTVVATLTLTMGVAFALGSREVVAHILAGHYLRQNLPAGRTAEVDGRRGVVERVGPVATVFRDGDRAWSVPNGRLLDEIVSH